MNISIFYFFGNVTSFSPNNSLLMPFPFLGKYLFLIFSYFAFGFDLFMEKRLDHITKIPAICMYNVFVMSKNELGFTIYKSAGNVDNFHRILLHMKGC